MKKREKDQELRRRAVNKGWNMIHNRQREDPSRTIQDVSTGREEPAQGPPPMVRLELEAAQVEVVGWIDDAIQSWFRYYFALSDGQLRERLTEVSTGLGKSSERLGSLATHIANIPGRGSSWYLVVSGYGDAVEEWSAALELVARGAQLDASRAAKDGLARLDIGASIAESVVDVNRDPAPHIDLGSPLRRLETLRPVKRVSKKAIAEAKRPWKRTLIAAGSALDW